MQHPPGSSTITVSRPHLRLRYWNWKPPLQVSASVPSTSTLGINSFMLRHHSPLARCSSDLILDEVLQRTDGVTAMPAHRLQLFGRPEALGVGWEQEGHWGLHVLYCRRSCLPLRSCLEMATGTRNPSTRRVLPDKEAGMKNILHPRVRYWTNSCTHRVCGYGCGCILPIPAYPRVKKPA